MKVGVVPHDGIGPGLWFAYDMLYSGAALDTCLEIECTHECPHPVLVADTQPPLMIGIVVDRHFIHITHRLLQPAIPVYKKGSHALVGVPGQEMERCPERPTTIVERRLVGIKPPEATPETTHQPLETASDRAIDRHPTPLLVEPIVE